MSEKAPTSTTTGVVRRFRGTWFRGGFPTRTWGWESFSWAVVGLGIGLVGGLWFADQTDLAGAVFVVWAGMTVPIVVAIARGGPRGVLAFRWVDLLYGCVFGIVLRAAQGGLFVVAGGSGAVPVYETVDGALPAQWWLTDLVGSSLVAPVVEEFFFRGVVLLSVFAAVRRLWRNPEAGAFVGAAVALVLSTTLFVVAHHLLSPLAIDGFVALILIAFVNGILVLRTGRIWGAVLVHVMYNATLIGLTVVGTLAR